MKRAPRPGSFLSSQLGREVCHYFGNTGVHLRAARVDYDIVVAKAVDHIDEAPSAPDRAVSAGALPGFKNVEWTNDTYTEDGEAIECLLATLEHAAIMEHVIENDRVSPIDNRAHRRGHGVHDATEQRAEYGGDTFRFPRRGGCQQLDPLHGEIIRLGLGSCICAAVVSRGRKKHEIVKAHTKVCMADRSLQGPAERGLSRT